MSFYQYIKNNNTDNTYWFTKTFDIELLPKTTICSSKILRDIFKLELENNYVKERVFRECFLEYFKYKLLHPIFETPLR
jgi:hypothetical protein